MSEKHPLSTLFQPSPNTRVSTTFPATHSKSASKIRCAAHIFAAPHQHFAEQKRHFAVCDWRYAHVQHRRMEQQAAIRWQQSEGPPSSHLPLKSATCTPGARRTTAHDENGIATPCTHLTVGHLRPGARPETLRALPPAAVCAGRRNRQTRPSHTTRAKKGRGGHLNPTAMSTHPQQHCRNGCSASYGQKRWFVFTCSVDANGSVAHRFQLRGHVQRTDELYAPSQTRTSALNLIFSHSFLTSTLALHPPRLPSQTPLLLPSFPAVARGRIFEICQKDLA